MAPLSSAITALVTAFLAFQTHAQTDIFDSLESGHISLLTNTRWTCQAKGAGAVDNIKVPINVCLSANFTLDQNVYIRRSGTCAGTGRAPYVALYASSDCTGDYSHPDWFDGGHLGLSVCVGKAAFGDVTPIEGQFSMAFRCGDEVDLQEDLKQMPISLPQVPAPPPPRRKTTTASTSDSACFIQGTGNAGLPRFIFQKPKADTCVNVKPKRKLKIYRNALCDNGTEALFARFDGKGCNGSPVLLTEVNEELAGTKRQEKCIDMGGEGPSSYTFWCTGELKQSEVHNDFFSEDGGKRIHYSNPPPKIAAHEKYYLPKSLRSLFTVVAVVCLMVAGLLMFCMARWFRKAPQGIRI